MSHILVVDDDEDITTLLTQYLARFGFTAHAAGDGPSLRAQMAAHPIDLIVLDIMLPGTDGLTLARELRQHTQVPIIMLTARANPYDCVLGLEMGADDYMAKPFEPRELVARIQSVLRRLGTRAAPPPGVVRFDGWALHRLERHRPAARRGGAVVERRIPPALDLPGHARRVCSRDQLMEQARGRAMDAFERSIDLLVSRLRHKLSDDPREPGLIKTVRGAGCVFNARSVQGYAGGPA